eukprot:6907168-Karenia_brevis.AAC.1
MDTCQFHENARVSPCGPLGSVMFRVKSYQLMTQKDVRLSRCCISKSRCRAADRSPPRPTPGAHPF